MNEPYVISGGEAAFLVDCIKNGGMEEGKIYTFSRVVPPPGKDEIEMTAWDEYDHLADTAADLGVKPGRLLRTELWVHLYTRLQALRRKFG